MITKYKVKDINYYLESLNEYFNDSNMWRTLQQKSEYGSNRSEKGYQQINALKASTMARELGLSPDKTELFTKILGAYFPQYGAEGKKCVREYLNEKNINISDSELASFFVELDLSKCHIMISSELKEILLELFSEKQSSFAEIELAKLYHEMTETLKCLYDESIQNYNELEQYFDNNSLQNIKELGIIGYRKKIIELKSSMPQKKYKMSEEEKISYKNLIDDYVKLFGKIEGICRFMSIEATPSNEKQKQ